MALNQSQKEAVAHLSGPCMVLAGPGSGKTLTIAKRIEYLIKGYKVRPEEILVITFTRYAANEMKQRFAALMRGENYPVTFGTFHGIYYWILKWAYGLDNSNILGEGEKYKILRPLCEKLEFFQTSSDNEEERFRELAEEIGNVKNRGLDIETYESVKYQKDQFRMLFRLYEKEKYQAKKLDFEDMLIMCEKLFTEHPEILIKWQKRFNYILIDEFQDINQVQYNVIRMLAAPQHNIFIVGDDDQSIYGFRGATPGIMQQFQKDYPNTKKVLLDTNYRSDANVVKGALRVIGHNKERFEKEIKAYHAPGENVHVQELKDPLEESKYIYKMIQDAVKKGTRPEQIAVLFRTANDARSVAETLAEYQVPFFMREKMHSIYDHFIAKDMISYLKLAEKIHTKEDLLRIINRPNRYIGRDCLSEERYDYESIRTFYCDKVWMQDRVDQLEWDMKMIRERTPYSAIQYLRKSVGYDEFLEEYAEYRKMDYAELKETMDEIWESTRGLKNTSEWLEKIERSKELMRKQEMMRRERVKNPDGQVMLQTIHGAKGLEYDLVILIAANEGTIPFHKAKTISEIEEERRLFYVAMTRARKKLVITYVKEKKGKEIDNSRFVNELLGSQKQKNGVK